MIQTILTLALSAAVGYVLYRKRVPAGMLIGAVIASAVLTAVFHAGHIPSAAKTIAQVIAGTFIGCLLDPSRFGSPVTVLWAVLITTAVLLVNAAVFGKWMEKLFGVPVREGMLMLTPAGASDMALISTDIGVSSPRLILVQIYRLIIATAIFPQICLLISGLFS